MRVMASRCDSGSCNSAAKTSSYDRSGGPVGTRSPGDRVPRTAYQTQECSRRATWTTHYLYACQMPNSGGTTCRNRGTLHAANGVDQASLYTR